MNPLDFLNSLSPNGKLVATAGTTGGVVGAGALAISGHWQLLLLLLMLVVIAIVAFVIFRLLVGWWQKRKSRPMEQSLAGNAGAAPQQLSGAKKLADLDSLRRVFATGVEKFHAAGKDLYSLPWYVLVGQPGSGKTEAIRHSAMGFPPGLQDQLQGSGGTINMNWWFTNQAIILDTAGRLMFEEVAPGATSEWQEFLKLLRTHRPNCPINGMLLVIPAESLLKDSGEVIARNAGKIAQQLDMIQRLLGVRFPVFVLITKADYLTGFSQFFDDLTDPQLQHQIMGWSNAAALDDPFNMDAVEDHLRQVHDRLVERRKRLLADPVNTEDPSHNRMDQVDSLFAFPETLIKLAPRLRQYLETIFVAGEWSAKPLFLRGIYFTSSMSEGKALDADLAQALGVSVDALPSSGVWRRDRAYFLRDLFLQKVFKERGLVTRAGNAMQQQRRRKMTVLAAGFAAVILLLGSTFYAFYELKDSIGAPRQYWQAAAKVFTSSSPQFMAIIVPKDNSGGVAEYVYQGHTNKILGHSLANFYQQGFDLVRKPLSVPWIFKPVSFLGGAVNSRQRTAFFKLYNQEVIDPVIHAAEARLAAAPVSDQSLTLAQLQARTHALLEFLALAHAGYQSGTASAMGRKDSLKNFDALLAYILSPADYKSYQTYQSDSTQSILASLYNSQRQWPPADLQLVQSVDFAAAVQHGMTSVLAGWNREVGSGNQALQRLIALKTALREYQKSETALIHWSARYQVSSNTQLGDAAFQKVSGLLNALSASAQKIKLNYSALASHASFAGAYMADAQQLLHRRQQLYTRLKQETAWLNAQAKTANSKTGAAANLISHVLLGGPSIPPAVLKKSMALLTAARTELLHDIASERSPFGSTGQTQIAALDQVFLARAGADREVTLRQNMYSAIAALVSTPADVTTVLDAKAFFQAFNQQSQQALAAITQTSATLKSAGPATAAAYNQAAVIAAGKAMQAIQAYRLQQMISQCVSHPLASAATIEQAVAQQVQTVQAAAVIKPMILFVPGAGKAFDPRFNPQGAGDLLSGWYEVGHLLRQAAANAAGAVPVLGASTLLARYTAGAAAWNSYRRAYYQYWLATLTDGLAVAIPGNNWKTFLQQLQGVQVDQLFLALQSYGNRVSRALAAVPASAAQAQRRIAAQADIQAGIQLLNAPLFARSTRHRFNRWTQLSGNPDTARNQLLSETPDTLYHRYILSNAATPDFASEYVKSVTLAGLRTLAQRSQQQANVILTGVQSKPFFPLFIPTAVNRSFKHEWSPAQIRALAKHFSALPKAVSADEILTPDSQVNRQLRILQGNVSYWHFGYSRTTVAAIRQILSAILGVNGSNALRCKLLITQAIKQDANDNTVEIIWPYLTINDAGKRLGTASFRSLSNDDLGSISIPEKTQQTLKLNFYETDPAVAGTKPSHSLVLHGPWAALKLLVRYGGTTKDGKTWLVHIHTVDQFKKLRTMTLEMVFSRALPPLSQWPKEKK